MPQDSILRLLLFLIFGSNQIVMYADKDMNSLFSTQCWRDGQSNGAVVQRQLYKIKAKQDTDIIILIQT